MDVTTHEVIEHDAVASGSVEELLADLDMDGAAGDSSDEVIEALTADEMEAVEVVTAVGEAYADQVTTTTDVVAPAADAAPATSKPKREKKAKAEKAKAAPKDLASIDPAVFVLFDDGEPKDAATLEANKKDVIALMPGQKKIAEKFENVFRALSVGKAPSVFVTTCFAVLAAAGSVTQGDLVGALKAADYNEGTARSQAGQIMALFHVLGVATREGQKLTYNANSSIGKRLAALPLTK